MSLGNISKNLSIILNNGIRRKVKVRQSVRQKELIMRMMHSEKKEAEVSLIFL